MEPKEIIHNQEKQRFELPIEDHKAMLSYNPVQPDLWSLNHTFVPGQLEGRGIGSELVRHVLTHCRNHDIRIIPKCPFIDAYIRRHPEWSDLVHEG
ncbi:MAG: GNAT family N-acetyltransferase [Bacteroidota bacterium]